MISPSKDKIYYIAGPMSWIPGFNVTTFLQAQQELEAMGFRVQLPADLDMPEVVAKLMASPDGNPEAGTTELTWGDCLALDVKLIADKVDGIICLPGWHKSRGARLETFVAFLCGKPVVHFGSLRNVSKKQLMKAWLGELFS